MASKVELINLEGEQLNKDFQQQQENIVQIKVEPTTKKVLVQFLKCSACNCEFSDALHRVAHINVSHPKVMQKEAWTPCSKCLMRFPRKDVLREHMKRVHHGGKSKCTICDDVFWTDSLYKQHWRKCVSKWVKSSKYLEENANVEEQLIHQQQQEEVRRQQQELEKQRREKERKEAAKRAADSKPREYLCAFCQFVFNTKEGYMEHTKHGQCVQPAHPGKYKSTNPVPCYYCSAHCVSRRALQAHVKEAHQVVTPTVKDENGENEDEPEKKIQCIREPRDVRTVYPCRPCNKTFRDQQDLYQHQQLEHFECENCYKYFSQETLEDHKKKPKTGQARACQMTCPICGHKENIIFTSGESFVDHMNDKHRSFVGVNWFQCAPCLKLDKRYYRRYYPTQRSLQMHLATVHAKGVGLVQASRQQPQTQEQQDPPVIQQQVVQTVTMAPSGTTIDQSQVQQFQIQFQDQAAGSTTQVVEQAAVAGPGQVIANNPNQQIQIIQTDQATASSDQPQIITLYTWGGQ